MRACLSEFVRRDLSIIPVLLPSAPKRAVLPTFLTEFMWVDLRNGLTKNGLDLIECGIRRRKLSTRASLGATVLLDQEKGITELKTWRTLLKDWLQEDFVEQDNDFRGFFAAHYDPAQSERWQSKDGEIVRDRAIPKRPYYETFWGYYAALRISPERIEDWGRVTVDAVERHFGKFRWIRVSRDIFEKGPRTPPSCAESVRHTARAADVLRMLDPNHTRVSEVAWALIIESDRLQNADGGWVEFRGLKEPSSLWATVYVYRFLACLVNFPGSAVIPEHPQFVEKAGQLLQKTETFLSDAWRNSKWKVDLDMPWQEVCAAVVPEVTEFFTNRTIMSEAFLALRSLIDPTGRLNPIAISQADGARPEVVQALNIAFALYTVDGAVAERDERYQRLVAWISKNLELTGLTTYEVAFAIQVLNLDAPLTKRVTVIPTH